VFTFSVEIEIAIPDSQNKEDAESELACIIKDLEGQGYIKMNNVKYIKHRNTY
jgi:hypothetical protein